MTKISNKTAYPQLTPLTLADYYPITSAATSGKVTRTTTLQEVQTLLFAGLAPEIGGTLKITPITYNGVLTSPAAVANALDPIVVVNRYEIVIFSINGDKYILKLQDLILGVGEADIADSDFITLSGYTKLGSGTNVLKGFNTSTGKQEFYALKSTGLDISIVSGDIVVESKAGANLGATGQILYKGLNATTKIHEFYKIDSDDFVISLTDNIVSINNPVVIDTPRFYVNSGYDIDGDAPENGSPSRPYKAIQSAITAYIGTGSAQTPQNINGDIIIQKGVGYTFTGSFAINTGTGSIILEEGCSVLSSPASEDWLCDYDALSSTAAATLNIVLNANTLITLSKSGFKNEGTLTNSGLYATRKLIDISGTGEIAQVYTSIDSNIYTIFESNYTTNNDYHNDSANHINVKGITISTNTQSIYLIGGNSKVNFSDVVLSINGATSLLSTTEFFNQKGGTISILNSNISITPFFGVQIDNTFPISKFAGIPSTLIISDTLLVGGMVTIFKNKTSLQSTVIITNLTNVDFASTNIAKSPSVVWTLFIPNNSVLYNSGNIDNTQIDLTGSNSRSHYNIFNGQIVETLSSYIDRASAAAAGLTRGNKFINRKTVNAVDLVAGVEYQVLTSGSPSLGTVGSYFTATGSETGTGTAYGYVNDILI